jgi:hypothetical protein
MDFTAPLSAFMQRMFAVVICVLITTVFADTAGAGNRDSSYDVNTLVIKYLHIDKNNIIVDPNLAPGTWWRYQNSYADTLNAVNAQILAMKLAAEGGSAYLRYQNGSAQAALRYHIVDSKEHIEAVPYGANGYIDYPSVMTSHNICDYVNNRGVREVWILKGRHRDGLNHWESFMQGPFGNIGNGGTESVPVCNHSYRVYTHTYDREDLFAEVWGHQLEAEVYHVSSTGSGPNIFDLFNVACYAGDQETYDGKTISPCYPRDPTSPVIPYGGIFFGQYFSNMTLTDPPAMNRGDARILFDWGGGSPDPTIPTDGFSVRWATWLMPAYTETYTFKVFVDDGVRLRIYDQSAGTETLVIDSWKDQVAALEGSIALNANQLYSMSMEYYENGGGAAAQLRWKSPSMPTVAKRARCGNVHNAPNARSEYDRDNTAAAYSDCMDWNPDGLGTVSPISCQNWINGCGKPDTDASYIFDNSVINYTTWHWQNMPGRNNTKTYQGQPLRNWWDVHGDFDGIMRCNKSLRDGTCSADLAVQAFLASHGTVAAGASSFNYYLFMSNSGPETVSEGKVTIALPVGTTLGAGFTSPQCTSGSPTSTGKTVTCYLGVVRSGEQRSYVLNVVPAAVGTLTATATLDVPGTFQDTATGNNVASAVTTITSVSGVDLFPTALSAARATNSATKVSVSETVKNQGTAKAGAFNVQYYLSTNTVFEPASDIPLAGSSNGSGTCGRALKSLNAAASSSVNGKTCYRPLGALANVEYYVLVVDDSAAGVSEYVEVNNTMVTSTTLRW